MSEGNPGDLADPTDGQNPTNGVGFGEVLQDLRAGGCNLLVVGDAPRRLFTEASASLLGGPEERRYRLLAITDASPGSVAERLPDPTEMPGSYEETTEIVNHASPPRSVAEAGRNADSPSLGDLSERRVVDPQLAGLQAELAEAMATFDAHAAGLDSTELRVAVDSLDALFEHYDEGVVRRCLQVVTGYVGDYAAMGHYVLTEPYGSERVRSLAGQFDAVVEIRPVDPAKHDHHAEERWHVSEPDVTSDWLPM